MSSLRLWTFYAVLYCVSYLVFPLIKNFDNEWVSAPALYNPELFIQTYSWAAVGMVMFLFGLVIGKRVHFFGKGINRYAINQRMAKRAWKTSLLVLGGVLAYLLLTHDLQQMLYDRGAAFTGEGPLLFFFATAVIYSNIFAWLTYYFYRSRCIVIIQIIVLFIAGFGSRGLILIFLISLLFMRRVNPQPRRKIMIQFAVFTLLFVSIFIGSVFFRTADLEGIPSWFIKRSIANTFEEGEMFAAVYERYRGNMLYGQTIADVRYVIYPRQIFSDKPEIWGKSRFEQELGFWNPQDGAGGVSVVFGQLSELYANFGGVGIFLGMFMWGIFFGSLELLRRNNDASSLGCFLYLMILYFLLWIFRHGVQGIVQVGIIPAVFLPVVIFFTYKKHPAPLRVEPLAKVKPMF